MTDDYEVKILVVDDDEDDFFILKNHFAEIHDVKLNVEWASSYEAGSSALLEENTYDICFMDYRLGIRTGLDLLKEAIKKDVEIPIILLTGYGEHDIDIEAMKVGAADFLVKDQIGPFLLEKTIRYAIHRSKSIAALREREEGFRDLLDSTFEGIIVHDSEGIILDANAAAAAIFSETLPNFLKANIFNYIQNSPKELVLVAAEVTGIRADEVEIQLEVFTKPYHYHGKPMRLTAVRDITAKKQLEAQSLTQDRLASIGLLASSLAHEIGTPLGVIRGRAEYVASHPDSEAHVKKNMEIIVSQIDRVSKLIHSLLNLARGEQVKEAGEVLLDRVISDVLDLMGHELKKNGIEVKNEVVGNIRLKVLGKAESLHQVLLNLIVNSMHAIQSAMKDGRATGHFIRIYVTEQGQFMSLNVEDSGCGISKKNLRNLFKPFFTTKDIGSGTGLGLVTSYRIVESWGGKFQVESEENVGSVFKILLPVTGVQDVRLTN